VRQIVERGVVVEDLKNEQIDRVGGVKQSFLPGLVLLSANGVDGLLVEESGHVLPHAAQEANKSAVQLHRRVLQKKQDGLIYPPVRRRTLIRSDRHNCQIHSMLR